MTNSKVKCTAIVKTGLLISVKCYLLNFKPSHVYLLPGLLFVSLFKPYCNKNKVIVGGWHCSGNQASHCDVLFDCSQQGPELKLLPTSATFTWSITLLMTQFLLYLLLETPRQPSTSASTYLTLRGWMNSHTWCWAAMSWRMWWQRPQIFECFYFSRTLFAVCTTATMPSMYNSCVYSDNMQGYTTLYIIPFIQFWIFNACGSTGVLSHPMNVCKYTGAYIAASRKHTETILMIYSFQP